MSAKSVLLFGDINVDNIFLLPEFPQPGRDGFAHHAELHLGGAVCNSAVVLQRLGQPATLLGAVGADIWSDFVFAAFEKAQVDAQHVVIKNGEKTGLIFIAVTPNGERTMLSYRGANNAITPEDLQPDLLEDICLIELSGYVFLEATQSDTAWRLVEMAVERSIPISLDTGLDPVILGSESILKVLPLLSILITGKAEAAHLTQSKDPQHQVDRLLQFGLDQVAIKLGHHGALLGWKGGMLQNPAFPVKVLDTTSAGDAFSAGIIYGYLQRFSPPESLMLANALGGLATTVPGAAWIRRTEVVSFLSDVSNSPDLNLDMDVLSGLLDRLSQTI